MATDRIPKEIRKDVQDVLAFIQPRLPFCPPDHQDYLFKIYNQYIKPTYLDDLKQDCNLCRTEVINKIRFVSRQWKASEENS